MLRIRCWALLQARPLAILFDMRVYHNDVAYAPIERAHTR